MSKVWFITGASSGFGAEMVKAIMAKGDKVAATFRKEEQANEFLKQHKEAATGIVLDVTKTDTIADALKQATEKFGRIDVLMNNAGYGTIGAIEEFSMDEIREQMETNFFGVIALTKAVLPIMRSQGSGHIVQVSSQAGFKATAGFGLYNASKFALEGFSEALAQEVSSFGIRVTIVEPGPFRTQFLGTSMRPAATQLDAYKSSPVGNMYKYVVDNNGKQEGDPVKAAQAIVDYVYSNAKALRLPLGKSPLQAMRLKLRQVEEDLKANEAIAMSTVFN